MDDMTVQKKRDFIVSCTAGCGVDITNGDGKKGGNVRTKGAKKIAWTNATSQSNCYLVFRQLPADGSPEDPAPVWPFTDHPPADRLLVLPLDARVERVLNSVAQVECVEYVVLGADKQPLLDPVIIIEPN
ncbi:MAG: hypothetical protein NDI84_05950 [Steroidobacteraceae bacterium]|nr:hypothetical protein [Steroidobacteraceae bacterium]